MKKIRLTAILLIAAALAVSCNESPDIKTDYDYSLSCWHLQKYALPGEEIEMRFTLTREADWKGAQYEIGYIQIEGKGEVYDGNGTRLINREKKPLERIAGLNRSNPLEQVFTLYYRSLNDRRAEVKIFLIDNHGKERTFTAAFVPEKEG